MVDVVTLAESMLADHVAYLERHGYSDCQSYVADVWPEVKPEILAATDGELNFSDCFRCYPTKSPSILWVQTNPGNPAGGAVEAFEHREMHERCTEAASMEDQIELSAKYGLEYLGSGERYQMIQCLQDSHPELPSSTSLPTEEYLQLNRITDASGTVKPMPEHSIDPEFGFFSDVYYTNLFKCFTENRSRIPGSIENAFAEHLYREIRITDPSVVLCSGQQAWRALRSAVEGADRYTLDDIEVLTGQVDNWDRFGSTKQQPDDGSVPASVYRFPDLDVFDGSRDVAVTWYASRGNPNYDALEGSLQQLFE